jgi:hypothetical protein
MLSTRDFEKLLFLYRTEWQEHETWPITHSNLFNFILNSKSGTLRSTLSVQHFNSSLF